MSNRPFMSASRVCRTCAKARTLQQRPKFAKCWAPPRVAARQKGTEVLVGVVDPCQIDIGDPRDGEAGRGGRDLDQEGFTVGRGERPDGLVAGQERGRDLAAEAAVPAPVVEAHGEV